MYVPGTHLFISSQPRCRQTHTPPVQMSKRRTDTTPTKIATNPVKRFQRSVFGSEKVSNSIFSGSNGILSPNFNVVNTQPRWNDNTSGRVSGNESKGLSKIGNGSGIGSSSNSSSNGSNSGKKLRRTNTNELMDRFIPRRQNVVGKLTISKTKSLPSFNMMPIEHIENQKNEDYQNTVAVACGLEVGQQRILKFQPIPPESKQKSNNNGGNGGNDNNNVVVVGSSNLGNEDNNKPWRNGSMRIGISTSAAQARMKKIPLCPEKVLDAPGLVDDFYLNLISWSNDNLLAIALGKSVYCWNANDGNVNLITECECMITSVKWSPDDYYLSIGLDNGIVEIWDIEKKIRLRSMKFNEISRIATQSWNNFNLTIGMKSGIIINNDVRISQHLIDSYNYHSSEVCGLEWRSDGVQLASGGNDNLVNIWDYRKSQKPIFTKTSHTAAVKAISWCPNQLSLLATGGGSACKKINFWNSNSGVTIKSIETESQVSSLQWGYSNGIGQEIVSTHGFPNNEICVYSYPSLQKTGVIMDAHDNRILKSELSPNGSVLATVSSDENLKFWKLFDTVKGNDENSGVVSGTKDMSKVMTIR